jgi:hypothetical protein
MFVNESTKNTIICTLTPRQYLLSSNYFLKFYSLILKKFKSWKLTDIRRTPSNGYILNDNILGIGTKTLSASKKEVYHWQYVFPCEMGMHTLCGQCANFFYQYINNTTSPRFHLSQLHDHWPQVMFILTISVEIHTFVKLICSRIVCRTAFYVFYLNNSTLISSKHSVTW